MPFDSFPPEERGKKEKRPFADSCTVISARWTNLCYIV